MIRVLSVIHYPVFGGPHNRNARLAPVLEKWGVSTTVVVPDEGGNAYPRLKQLGIDVVKTPLSRLRATVNPYVHLRHVLALSEQLRSLRALIRGTRADLVQLNGYVNPHAALAASSIGVPVIWQIVDTYTPSMLRWLLAPLVRRYSNVVMCTGQAVARIHRMAIRAQDHCVLFYPPVDVEMFRPREESRHRAREEMGLKEDQLVVGTIANVNKQKGLDDFVRAAAALKGRVPESRFVILGATGAAQKSYATSLRELATRLGLRWNMDIQIKDPRDRVAVLASAFDVFWMTSRPNSEGIPTAMEEAMALELPVVTFPAGSIPELVHHGESGYIVKSRCPDELAEVTAVSLQRREQRIKMGTRGRRFVMEHASIEACARQHVRAYEIALERSLRRVREPAQPVR